MSRRKIIQIVSDENMLYALCDDGEVWVRNKDHLQSRGWELIDSWPSYKSEDKDPVEVTEAEWLLPMFGDRAPRGGWKT